MADKGKILGIVAWSLVVILLVGVSAMALSSSKQAARADELQAALMQVGTATGVEELPESVEGEDALLAVVQQLEGAILGDKQELLSTKDALTAAQDEASRAQAEVTALTQGAEQSKAKADSLAKELAAKSEELDTAKAQAAKAEKTLEKAKASAAKKASKLKAKLDDAKAELAAETARLQGELDATLQQAATQESTGEEVAAEVAMGEESADVEAVTESEEVIEEVVVEEEAGRVIGQSKMFTLIRYSTENDSLFLLLQDGQTLSYQNVPADIVDDMLTSEAKLDMKYRFNIQGNYKSLPPDSIVIRKFWKNEHYRPQAQDVRLIEDEPLPEVIVEDAPSEIAVEEVIEAVVEE